MSSSSERKFPNSVPQQPSNQQRSTYPSDPQDNVTDSDSNQSADSSSTGRDLQQPIPPPSEPMQYRAIGLIQGRYIPSEEQFNRGQLLTPDGVSLDAVLLGQVMGLLKKHLDLSQDHLWVVYPRTREKQSSIHVQIVGVWEPEELQKLEVESAQTQAAPSLDLAEPLTDGYFSIRGEVMFQAQEKEYVIVEIQQSPRKSSETLKAFKLRLEGTLTPKAIGYFWDLNVRRQATSLVIEQAQSVARVPPKKFKKSSGVTRGGSRGRSPARGQIGDSARRPSSVQSERRSPVEKPIKRNTPPGG